MLSAPLCQNLGYDNVHKACPPIYGMSGIPLKFHIHVFTMIIKIDFFFKGEQMTKQHRNCNNESHVQGVLIYKATNSIPTIRHDHNTL